MSTTKVNGHDELCVCRDRALPPPEFGNLGRNTVIGPGRRRVDASLSKITPFVNGTSVELRVEASNVTNTPSFRNFERDLSSDDFGEITRTRGGPRVFQLGVKFRF